ncbi:MAG: phage terminase large subunit [Pseudomonadota bacterium]
MARSRPNSSSGKSPNAKTIELYGNQYNFAVTPAHYAALNGGIASGKSIAGAVRALAAARGNVGGQKVKTPNVGMVTAPTYPMLRDASIRTFIEIAGPMVADWRKSENIATLVNGSEVLFRTADDPNRLRGPNITWWWGDEASYCDSAVWLIMIGRLRQHGFGYAWVTSTPKGRNWLYREFVQQQRPDYTIFNIKTTQNPFLDPAYVSALQGAYTGDWARQELEGEFVAFEGLVYAEFQRDVHMTTDASGPYAYYVAGVDWGYANPGIILIFGVDGDGRMTLVREEYQRQRRIEEWAALARSLHDTFSVQTFYCDPAEPDFITAFQSAGVAAVAATNDVLPGIQAVKNRLVTRGDGRPRLRLSAEAVQTAVEFEQYAWMENRDGVRDAPKKVNDHCMDALRYAVMGLETNDSGLFAGALNYGDSRSAGSYY